MHNILLSALQHYVVCPRQCALIHMEQIWTENEHTAAGRLLHESVHSGETRLRDGVRIVTDLELHSARLGLRGKSDAVELHRDGRRWRPYPVEYKKGRPKYTEEDILQLTAQTMCLEEMFSTKITEGAIFYGETRRRKPIVFTDELRDEVKKIFGEMHDYYDRNYTPKVKTSKRCVSCSLKDICMPKIDKSGSVKSYINKMLGETL